ncbi:MULTISPECIES: TetR/AcrR family transcriptional regulator [unclassified Nocardioides]|uniref:TetR/AcrR family transcriptional regulator n=1 Tax=unclassified Nocardioides TaxID=2615069 RepID=UPI000A442374|nr:MULTISPECIES: TetR/AcrR family transcriptional regulator [unclassified Nocardioides]
MSTTPMAPPRKLNRRGVAAREKLLSTALEMLGTGKPEAVSINLVAREAGLSWGSVQNLFGDSDGFWSAVVERITENKDALWPPPVSDTIAGRIAEVSELYRRVLVSPYAVAIDTIRLGLPRPRPVLSLTHPLTAAALTRLEADWAQSFLDFFEDVRDQAADQQRFMEVAWALPISLHGLAAHETNGASADADAVYRTMVASMTAYLEG